MNNNTAAVQKRPRKFTFVLMCIFLAVLLAANVALIALVPKYFDTINKFMDPGPSGEEVDGARQASAEMTREIESEGIILLENRGNTLPLAKGIPVNLFGYGSVDTVYGGSGSGSGDESRNITLSQGLVNAGFSVNQELTDFYQEHYVERAGVGYTGNNFDINETPVSAYSEELLANAREFSDVAVVVISRLGGEGADLPMDMTGGESALSSSGSAASIGVKGGDAGKHYLELQQSEQEMLNLAKENFGTVIVLINSTNTMELGFLEDEGVDAALWIGCLGSAGANAVGDVLSGAVNPSGRTTDIFAYALESAPTYYSIGNYDYTNITYVNTSPVAPGSEPDCYHYVDYREGIYVGYRFYETAAADGFIDYDSTVQYPFGYGKSYTDFQKEIVDFKDDGREIQMDVKVTNTGAAAGKTVVQVYYTPPYTAGGIEKSQVALADFGKTGLLEPGASETVTLSFSYEDMASYDYNGVKANGGAYVLEAGDYEIRLMENSHDLIESRTVTVKADVIYDEAHDGPRSTDKTDAVNRFDDVSFGENAIWVSRADWENTMPVKRAEASRMASESTLAALNGTQIAEDPDAEDILYGDHGLTLADVKGLPYDDAAWSDLLEQISLQEMVNLTANGGWTTAAVPSVKKPGFTEVDGPNGINDIMAGKNGNQYPGQSVLGCTWNQQLAYRMGETFAKEAVAMRITGLYAPGLNIHRSPFGGRNYEYFSEDGAHTGKLAAAEIQGIQSQGVYCYAKHFAVNDQESNRDNGGLCTWVNEQAMREIYLKGFELAVKEGGTVGMMAAFNRLGSVNCAESRELLTEVLRNEWGFRGTVITDCIIQLSYIDVDRCLRAGCDLQLSLMNLHAPGEATTGTAAGRQALRQATHNILYTVSSGEGLTIAETYVPYWLYISVGIADILLLGLCALYFIRRHKKWKMWKAVQK